MAIKDFTFSCTAAVTGLPGWMAAMTPFEWTTPVNTNRIQDVVPAPPYANNETTDDITGAGNGAGVDQVNKSMIIAATGGHAGWWGSDGYELQLTPDIAPAWRRIVDWLPSYVADVAWITQPLGVNNDAYEEWGLYQMVDYGYGVPTTNRDQWLGPDGLTYDRYNWPTTLCDGASNGQRVEAWKPWTKPNVNTIMDRPRPGHTCWSIHYDGGKLWFPITQGSNNGSGRGSRVPHSLDIDYLRTYMATHGGQRYTYEYGNKVPYTYYPVIPSNATVSSFGASAIDTGTGRIWFQGANTTEFFRMETRGATPGAYTLYSCPFSPQQRFTIPPNAICPDVGRRMWVVVCTLNGSLVPVDEIVVYDLDAIEAGTITVTKVSVPNLGILPWARLRSADECRKGYGMVWHAPSRAFILFNSDESPRDTSANTSTLFLLYPPLDVNGNWVRGNAWSVATRTVPGIPAVTSAAGVTGITGSSFSRFNIVHWDNGESLLISQGNVLNAPSFMRLSTGF